MISHHPDSISSDKYARPPAVHDGFSNKTKLFPLHDQKGPIPSLTSFISNAASPYLPLAFLSSPLLLLPPPHRDGLSCRTTSRMRMATSPRRLAEQPWSLNDLSSELLALILEHLRDIDPPSAATSRRLSRRFEAVATPIVYHVLCLNESIVSTGAEARYPNLFRNVAAHTNHVVARSNLDPFGIKRVLDRVRRLQSVQWDYVVAEFNSGLLWLPSDVLKSEQTRHHTTKLHVQGLPLREFEGHLRDTYVRAIPTDLLTTLKLASPAPPLTTRLNSLKQLLLLSRRLETFHYEDRGQGTNFKFSPSERMPALKELVLKSYDWNHSREDVNRNWDFSRLESLDLVSVPIFNFLVSVNFSDLANLQRLHCEDYSAHQATDKRQDATRGLHLLVKKHIRALHSLSLTCHISSFPLDGILAHASTLRSLRFRDHVGFGEEDRRCPTLWPADLETLGRQLPFVHTLEIDMDIALCDPPEFLRAICAFKKLHTLTLHVQTVLHPLEIVHPGMDRDHDAAVRTFGYLIQCKQDLEARAVPGCGPQPWRHMTINVGGWRRAMVRRFSAAWRRQNEQGVFAERCFILERDGGSSGRLTFREERCVETRSTTPTPERMLRSV